MPRKYFVERITGDLAEVHVMVPPGRSPATYEPTPKQVSILGGADVFFTLGDKPSPKQLQRVISLAKERGVRVVFVQPEFSKTSARRVAEAINGAVVEVAPLKLDYLQNMRFIAQEIRQGLEEK